MKQVFLETFGCQMNVADSDRMESLLFQSGYLRTDQKEEADLIVVNTCSVREKAEQKVYSLFGQLLPLKEKNPDLILGLAGCLAQQEGDRLARRIPDLDFILGPDTIENISDAVAQAARQTKPLVWTRFDSHKEYSIPVLDVEDQPANLSAFVNIIKGCDKFCSFCIVPYTRGREKSREAEEIYAEVRSLVKRGAKEIFLLGQNVNAYGKHGLNKPIAFHELLYGVAEIPGVERLRFTTSYPGDFTEGMIRAYKDLDILMNHLHLPVQSGNDRILELMRRGHTAAEYRDMIARLRDAVPDIAVSSDIIVGFPTETEAEFEDTLKLMEEVDFDNNYMFSYSPRPGAPAAEWEDTVPEADKKLRLQKTMDLQNRLTLKNAQAFVGRKVEILVAERMERNGSDFKGRSPQYWTTHITGGNGELNIGDTAVVEIKETKGRVLIGRRTASGNG